jgi:tetratricopeptide (TPR) repeat protein
MMRLRSLCYLACLLLACVTVSARGQQEAADPEEMFARAVQLHQSGDYEDAVREYEGFLKVRPDRVDARSNLGAAYVKLGRYEDAIAQYKQALEIDGKNVAIRFNLALAFYKGAHFQEAYVEFEQVVAKQPENRNAIILLADCDLRIGENKKVLELLLPLEANGQGDRMTAFMVGTALINDNQVDRGKVFIDRILRDGDSAEAHALLGGAYLQAGDYQSAMEELKRAVDLNPNLETVHSLYGRALLFSGNPDPARIQFEAELKSDPNDFDSNLCMGLLFKQDAKFDQALIYFQHAGMVRPGDLLARYYLGSTYLGLGRLAEAEQFLSGVVKEAPAFAEAHVALATAYYRLKRKEDGDHERQVIQKLNAEKQAKERGAGDNLGPGYHGEVPKVERPSASQEKPLQ